MKNPIVLGGQGRDSASLVSSATTLAIYAVAGFVILAIAVVRWLISE